MNSIRDNDTKEPKWDPPIQLARPRWHERPHRSPVEAMIVGVAIGALGMGLMRCLP